MKYFQKLYECSYHLGLLAFNLCKYQKIPGGGGIKESDNFSDFFHYFLFSHKLIKHFMEVVGHSLVIKYPNIHSRP